MTLGCVTSETEKASRSDAAVKCQAQFGWLVSSSLGRFQKLKTLFAVCVCGPVLSTVTCPVRSSPVDCHHFPSFITCILCCRPLLPVFCVSSVVLHPPLAALVLLRSVSGCSVCLALDYSFLLDLLSFSSCFCLTLQQNLMCAAFVNF